MEIFRRRDDWLSYLRQPNHDPLYDVLWSAAEDFEGGRRLLWVMSLWQRFLAQLCPDGYIHALPACALRLRSAYDAVTEGMSPQMRKKALAALRSLVGRCTDLRDVLIVMPRFVATRRNNPLTWGA